MIVDQWFYTKTALTAKINGHYRNFTVVERIMQHGQWLYNTVYKSVGLNDKITV